MLSREMRVIKSSVRYWFIHCLSIVYPLFIHCLSLDRELCRMLSVLIFRYLSRNRVEIVGLHYNGWVGGIGASRVAG